jgi:hypothetical protein
MRAKAGLPRDQSEDELVPVRPLDSGGNHFAALDAALGIDHLETDHSMWPPASETKAAAALSASAAELEAEVIRGAVAWARIKSSQGHAVRRIDSGDQTAPGLGDRGSQQGAVADAGTCLSAPIGRPRTCDAGREPCDHY